MKISEKEARELWIIWTATLGSLCDTFVKQAQEAGLVENKENESEYKRNGYSISCLGCNQIYLSDYPIKQLRCPACGWDSRDGQTSIEKSKQEDHIVDANKKVKSCDNCLHNDNYGSACEMERIKTYVCKQWYEK